MQTIVMLVLVSTLLYNASAQPESPDHRYEIGVFVGEPTGITGKYWLTRKSAIDAIIGWSFSNEIFDLAADYQYHIYIPNIPRGTLPAYFGAGGALRFKTDDTFFGIRFPLGGEYFFDNVPLGAFVEIAPIFQVLPDTRVRLEGGVGLRFTF